MAIIEYVTDTNPTPTAAERLSECAGIMHLLETWRNQGIITAAQYSTRMDSLKLKADGILTEYLE
jgi:hypothetical protein